jgi:acetate kinase
MVAAPGALDVLVFTGWIGEHAPAVRAAAADGLLYLGVAVEPHRNRATTEDGDITAPDAPLRTVVITAREDLEAAREVRALLD